VKALILILLIVVVFGSGAYWTHRLYLRPQQALKEEKALPPEPPPPDSSLPEFESCMALVKGGKVLEAREALAEFIEHNPQSTKLAEAKAQLGAINVDLFLSTKPAPDKEVYTVKSGDVLNRVATRMKSTPELIARANKLQANAKENIILRIGQQLTVPTAEFSLIIRKTAKTVTLLNRGKFFKEYSIRSVPASAAAPKKSSGAPPKLSGKVNDKIAWAPSGTRVIFTEKEHAEASHWIVVSVGGHTLYAEPDPGSDRKVTKPPTGLGLAPEDVEELAVLLRKGDPVTVEP